MDAIVGIRTWDDRTLRIYRRVQGSLIADSAPLQPWLAIADPTLLEPLSNDVGVMSLAGDEGLKTVVQFDRWPHAWDAIQRILTHEAERRRQRVPSYLDLSGLLFLSEPAEQWLTATGSAFLRGLSVADLVRLQLAIETASPPGRPSRSDRSQDRILSIAATLSDGRKSTFRLKRDDEATLLREFRTWFESIDPDVVEGIDLLSFTLPYIAERCALNSIDPAFGREGAPLRLSASPVGKGPWEIPGRIVLDPTDAMRHAGPTIHALVVSTPTVRKNVVSSSALTPLRRCQETRRRSDPLWSALLPIIQHVPLPPDRLFRSGPGHWLESWLIGERLSHKNTIPATSHTASSPPETVPAGMSGWFAPAAELVLVPSKAFAWRQLSDRSDSQAPGWIRAIRNRWEPLIDDTHEVVQRSVAIALLTGLTDAVRARTSRLHDAQMAELLDRAIGNSAAAVSSILRRQNVEVLQEIGERLYVQYPDNLSDENRLRKFWDRINALLPNPLHAIPLRTFDSIVSLAPRIMHGRAGNAVIQLPRIHPYRSPEAFLREYHAQAVALILRRHWNHLHQLTLETILRIRNRSWHISEFCRRETLSGSLEDYVRDRDARRRNPSAPYEALLRAHGSVGTDSRLNPETGTNRRTLSEAGSTVVYYIAGNRKDLSMAEMSRLAELWDPAAPDENTEHYLDRLRQSLERYRLLLSEADFSRIFGEESLFPFRDEEIGLVRSPFAATGGSDMSEGSGSGIWLDVSTPLT